MSPSHHYTDASRGVRLQKALAVAGVGSRRACEALIESGRVKVNGHVVDELPAWVDPEEDRITVGGRRISRSRDHIYVMLYKPRGVVSTNRDPEGRRRAIDLVKHPSGVRLFPVGRLDLDSSGLLLLTNDGELANRLTHPRYELHKTYEVTVRGALDDQSVRRLQRGLFLPERGSRTSKPTSGSRLKIQKRDSGRTRLLMELREGRNRQIRRMMLRVGHPVKKLRRIKMGPLKLSGLRHGEWRELTPQELAALRRAAHRTDGRPSKRTTKRPAKRTTKRTTSRTSKRTPAGSKKTRRSARS